MGTLLSAFERAEKANPAEAEDADTGKSLSQRFDHAVKQVETAPVAPVKTPPAEQPGILASIGAGAGEAVGRGALAIQQLAGKGISYLGDTLHVPTMAEQIAPGSDANVLQQAGGWLQNDANQGVKKLAAENEPYQSANPKSNFAGEITGMLLSPVNKLVPMGGPTTTWTGAIAKGVGKGAGLNMLTAPADESEPFLQQKAQQGVLGGLGGGVGGALGYGLSQVVNKGIDAFRSLTNKVTAGDPAIAADVTLSKGMADIGINPAQVKTQNPALFDSLKSDVQDAIAAGKQVDAGALTRRIQAQTLPVPVPMLKGQITRDPMQFAKEQNLRGIKGVGEPITETYTAQNRALIDNLDAMGAKSSPDVITGGKSIMDALSTADKARQTAVGDAYDAFKKATGRELDVPLTGLAQDYAATAREFGDAIPRSISSKFEALGLMSGTTKQMFSIGDAEALIKSINRNYDPSNRVQARALDELRRSVQKAISEGAGASATGTEAAGLAGAARLAAKQRFDLIDETPGLKAAIQGQEPDKFVQKYVLQGNVGEIKNMMDVLGKQNSEAVSQLQNTVMGFIKSRVLNNRSDGNAAFSSDQFKQFVKDPYMSARLSAVFGPQKMAQLQQLYSVAENALYAPVSSAVNRSNTASAAANLVKSEVQGGSMNNLLEIAKRVPILSNAANYGQESVQSARASKLIDEAVNPSLGKQSGYSGVAQLVNPGAVAGAAALRERNRRAARN